MANAHWHPTQKALLSKTTAHTLLGVGSDESNKAPARAAPQTNYMPHLEDKAWKC